MGVVHGPGDFCDQCGRRLRIAGIPCHLRGHGSAGDKVHHKVRLTVDKLGTVQGHDVPMTQLGERYETGHGVARNSDEALRCYCKAARLGNSEARLRLVQRGAEPLVTSADSPSDRPSPPVATEPQTP